jgi:hypothetical protein
VNDELERMWKETAAASVGFYPNISLERLEKTTKRIRHDSWPLIIRLRKEIPEQAASQPGVMIVLSRNLVIGRAVVPGDCMW